MMLTYFHKNISQGMTMFKVKIPALTMKNDCSSLRCKTNERSIVEMQMVSIQMTKQAPWHKSVLSELKRQNCKLCEKCIACLCRHHFSLSCLG